MEKKCNTCFYEQYEVNAEPCASCMSHVLWVPKDIYNEQTKVDLVNNPAHYTKGIQPIDAIESWNLNFRLANVIKYVARADHKGSRIEDLKKARWYLDREISKYEPDI